MNNQAEHVGRKVPRWVLIAGAAVVAVILLARCGSSGNAGIDLSTATCESLIPQVIEMSQDRELEILEITSPRKRADSSWTELSCDGSAEWSQGEGRIIYGAHESDGGSIILEYKQD
jgi:outer membrane murein-binding lipoprotein Lpp